VTLNPIGIIQTNFGEEEIRRDPKSVVSNLIINRGFTEALDGIESYSHLIVIYYMHKIKVTATIKKLKIHPRGRKDIKKVGLLSYS
jgi:tRNA (Thr-GGU) A37 N-methylase